MQDFTEGRAVASRLEIEKFPLDFPFSGNFPETNSAQTALAVMQAAAQRLETETDRRTPQSRQYQRAFAFLGFA